MLGNRAILRPSELAPWCAQHPATVEGAWNVAIDYARSKNKEEAVIQLSDRSFRSNLPQQSLLRAEQLVHLLGARAELKPIMPSGHWPLDEVEDAEYGTVHNLSHWLQGANGGLLVEDGRFTATLKDRTLKGTWELQPHGLVLADDTLGEVDVQLLEDSLIVTDWTNESHYHRYSFRKPIKAQS